MGARKPKAKAANNQQRRAEIIEEFYNRYSRIKVPAFSLQLPLPPECEGLPAQDWTWYQPAIKNLVANGYFEPLLEQTKFLKGTLAMPEKLNGLGSVMQWCSDANGRIMDLVGRLGNMLAPVSEPDVSKIITIELEGLGYVHAPAFYECNKAAIHVHPDVCALCFVYQQLERVLCYLVAEFERGVTLLVLELQLKALQKELAEDQWQALFEGRRKMKTTSFLDGNLHTELQKIACIVDAEMEARRDLPLLLPPIETHGHKGEQPLPADRGNNGWTVKAVAMYHWFVGEGFSSGKNSNYDKNNFGKSQNTVYDAWKKIRDDQTGQLHNCGKTKQAYEGMMANYNKVISELSAEAKDRATTAFETFRGNTKNKQYLK